MVDFGLASLGKILRQFLRKKEKKRLWGGGKDSFRNALGFYLICESFS